MPNLTEIPSYMSTKGREDTLFNDISHCLCNWIPRSYSRGEVPPILAAKMGPMTWRMVWKNHFSDLPFSRGTYLSEPKILTFRARFEMVNFGPKIRPEMAGKLQSVRRKKVPISAF